MTRLSIGSLVATLAAVAAVLLPACTSVEPAPAAAAAAPRKVLQGSVIYRERVALPDNAQIKVQLVDATTSAAPAVFAETTFAAAGRQVPVPFSLPVDNVKVEPGRVLALRATILVDGVTRYVTATRVNVDIQALPASVTILVAPGTAEPAATDSPAPPGAMRPPAPQRPAQPRGSQPQPATK
jgi:putative lipoprotein